MKVSIPRNDLKGQRLDGEKLIEGDTYNVFSPDIVESVLLKLVTELVQDQLKQSCEKKTDK